MGSNLRLQLIVSIKMFALSLLYCSKLLIYIYIYSYVAYSKSFLVLSYWFCLSSFGVLIQYKYSNTLFVCTNIIITQFNHCNIAILLEIIIYDVITMCKILVIKLYHPVIDMVCYFSQLKAFKLKFPIFIFLQN